MRARATTASPTGYDFEPETVGSLPRAVPFPYTELFVALLLAYMAYSVWVRLDARYPIAAALVLLVITAVVDALGATGPANTLAEFVFFLLGAGVVLLLIEHVRDGRSAPAAASPDLAVPSQAVAADAAHEPERPTDQSFNGFEEEPVAVVDTPGEEYAEDEEPGEAERDYHET